MDASVLLAYTVLALFMAAGYGYNGVALLGLATYIRKEIEAKTSGLGWETFVYGRAPQGPGFGLLGWVSTGGLYIVTEFLAVGLGLSRFGSSPLEWILLVASIFCILLTLVLLWYLAGLRR